MADVIAALVLSGYAGGAIITARWSLWDDARTNGGELPDGAAFSAGVCAVLWPGILVLGAAWCAGKYVLRPVLRFLIVPRLVKKTRAAKEFAAREERIEELSDEVRAGDARDGVAANTGAGTGAGVATPRAAARRRDREPGSGRLNPSLRQPVSARAALLDGFGVGNVRRVRDVRVSGRPAVIVRHRFGFWSEVWAEARESYAEQPLIWVVAGLVWVVVGLLMLIGWA